MWCTSREAKHDQKIRQLPPHRITGTIKNKECYAMTKCNGQHKMVLRYMKCSAIECNNKCNVQYRTIVCPKKKEWLAYQR